MAKWRVEFYRLRRENPVVEELLALRAKDVRLATEVVQDLKDLEEFGLDLPEKRLHTRSKAPISGSFGAAGSTGSRGLCSSKPEAGFWW